MSDKYRSISLVVAVLIFLAGNIIAGYYKWGASSETPDRQVLLKDTAEDIGNQKKHNNKLTNELNSLKKPTAVEETASGKTDANHVGEGFKAKIASLNSGKAYRLSTQRIFNDLAVQQIIRNRLLNNPCLSRW